MEAFPEPPAEIDSPTRPSSRDWYLLGAAACMLGSWLPITIGGILDADPLLYLGVVSLYFGVGWAFPGILVGAAVKQSAEARGARHPTRAAVATAIAVGFAALVVSSAILAAMGYGDLADTDVAATAEGKERSSARGDQDEKIATVAAAARLRSSRSGGVSYVLCQKAGAICVVSYGALTCELWLVEQVNGVDVARPFGPRIDGHGTYDDNSPENVGCSSES